MSLYHHLSKSAGSRASRSLLLAQVDVAEPWTAGSIATTVVLVGAIVAWVIWRIRRNGAPPEG